MIMGVVDVRDVAEAHFQAGFTPEAKGRYITSAHNTNVLEMTQALLLKYGDILYPIPKKTLPKERYRNNCPFSLRFFLPDCVKK